MGEAVYLKLRPYCYRSLAKKPNEKLSPRYYGPYKILERIGRVAYRLKLPTTARIHSVFHVSQLKRAVKATAEAQPLPQGLTEDLELQVQSESVQAIRQGEDGKLQHLLKWKDHPDCENTWEDGDVLRTQFPQFHLEDKVPLADGGNDGPEARRWGQVYKRKSRGSKAQDNQRVEQGQNGHNTG